MKQLPWLCLAVLFFGVNVSAYQGSDHQFLTFLAAKQFNRCVEARTYLR